MEDQPFRRSRRLQNLPLFTTVDPLPPPQRRRLDIDGSFKPVGISEVLGELELRTNQVDTTLVEIEDLQANKFVRNFNSPLTNLNYQMIVQVHPFNSPLIVVLVGRLMSSEGDCPSTSTLATLVEGVPLPLVGAPRENIPTTPLTPSSRVV